MELVCKTTGRALVASLRGELDHHNAAQIRQELENRFSALGMRNLIFDLSGLRFMDSSGLGVLIGRYKTVSALGGQTRICAPTPEVDRLLRLCGMYKIIPLYETLSEAASGL